MKKQRREWRKIFANNISDKGINIKIYGEFIQFNSNKNLILKWAEEQTSFQWRHTNYQQVHEKMLSITNHQGNANQKPQWDITSYLIEWLSSKRQEWASVGNDVEKREPLCIVGGNVNCCSHYRKQYGGSSKK